jgi:hypothetical protein
VGGDKMEEHGSINVVHIFIETDAFATKPCKISESVRERLYFDLMLGRGTIIEDTGGLKEFRCGSGAPDGKGYWDVVFADYNCPATRVCVYFLLVKFPNDVIKKLSQEQKDKLRILKGKVDEYVLRHYGT